MNTNNRDNDSRPINVNSGTSIWDVAGTLLLVGVGAGVVYVGYKGIKGMIDKNQNKVDDVKKEIDKNDVTLSKAQLSIMCGQLFTAMNGNATTMSTIRSVLSQLKTSSDWYSLVKEFGVRKLEYTYVWPFTQYVEGNLTQLFESEFDDGNKAEVQKILNNLTPSVNLYPGVSGLGQTKQFTPYKSIA